MDGLFEKFLRRGFVEIEADVDQAQCDLLLQRFKVFSVRYDSSIFGEGEIGFHTMRRYLFTASPHPIPTHPDIALLLRSVLGVDYQQIGRECALVTPVAATNLPPKCEV